MGSIGCDLWIGQLPQDVGCELIVFREENDVARFINFHVIHYQTLENAIGKIICNTL